MNHTFVSKSARFLHPIGRLKTAPVQRVSALRAWTAVVGAILLACCLAAPLSMRAAAVLWNGAGFDQNWSSADNWSNSIAPAGPTDNVFFLNDPPPASTAVQGAINSIIDLDYTVGSLNIQAVSPNFQGLQIPAGVTLKLLGVKTNTIGSYVSPGALFVGSGADSGSSATVYATIAGGGTLFISNAIASVDVTQTSVSSAPPPATLDMSGLSQFTAYINDLKVGNGASVTGNGAGNRSSGTLLLAQNNVITFNSASFGMLIGNSPQNNGRPSNLRLGQANSFFSDFGLSVGRLKSGATPAATDTSTMNFNSGLTSPTALFRNKAGTGPMIVWTVGDNSGAGSIGSNTRGLIDFTGGIVDAWVGSIILGRSYNANGPGTANCVGTLTFDAGTIVVTTNIEAGYMMQNNNAVLAGTVNLGGTATLVVSNDIRLGRYVAPGTNLTGSATGTININGGTVTVGGRIYDDGGNSSVNLTNGTIDLLAPADVTPGTITVDRLNFAGGVITNAATISVLSNFYLGATAIIASNTVLDFGVNSVADVRAVAGGFSITPGQTLQGAGSIFGDVVQTGGSTISPGSRGVARTLTITNDLDLFSQNSLTLNSGGNLTFDLSNDPSQIGGSNDLVVVRGDLNINGPNVVTLNPLNGDFANGTYRLFDYFGFLNGDTTGFTVSGPIAQSRRSLIFDNSVANQINLVVGGTTPASLQWVGDGAANNWDVKTTADWRIGASPEMFYYLDNAVFDDTGSASPSVNLVGSLVPTTVTVNNETASYTFAGSGSVNAVAGLTKLGASSLTIANTGSNSFGAPIAIGGGTLRIGGDNRLPTNSTVNLSNVIGAALDLDGFAQTIGTLNGVGSVDAAVSLGNGALTIGNGGTFDGSISGAGRMTMNGIGTLLLSGNNTFAGGLTINTGIVTVANATGSGAGAGAVLISGGILRIGTNSTVGSIAPQPGGFITNHGQIDFNRSDTNLLSEVITGNGSVRLLGRGTMIFAHDNTYTNLTTVNNGNGVLRILSPNALGTLEGGTIVNGGNVPAPGTGGQLELAGDVVFAPERLTLACRGTNTLFWNVPSGLVNQSGTNTWTGPIDITQGGSYVAIQSDAGLLRITGSLSGGPIATSTRVAVLRGVADGEFSGVISNGPVTTALSIFKGDSGTWTLSGDNLYTGSTLVSNGTLVVNGTVRGSAVNATFGTLGGAGLITAPVTIGASGTLAPGASIGTLTISNNLTLNGTTLMEVGKAGATAISDQVRGLSNIVFGGTLTLQLTSAMTGGEVFKLFDAAAYSGAFVVTNLPALASGLSWNTSTLGIDGTVKIDGTATVSPRIDGIQLSGSDIIISGSGGTAGGNYYVLVSTNVALPLVNWTPIATNVVGPGGLFIFTNTVNTNTPQLFYDLQLP